MADIGFLHTSSAHTATFQALTGAVDASISVSTVVDERALEIARAVGPEHADVKAAIERALDELAGADVVVCTCSTLGGVVEALGRRRPHPVMRVDRPMAIEAVRLANRGNGRVVVVAAIETTLGPTVELVGSVALEQAVEVAVDTTISEGAWEHFESGDIDGYRRLVAATCREVGAGGGVDVIVLAQASMDGAGALAGIAVPILSSPSLAVLAAIDVLSSSSSGREG